MPSLTLDEARDRAARISTVTYDLHLDVRDTETFGSRVRIGFETKGGDTFLELYAADRLEVTLDGALLRSAYDGHRIQLLDLSPGPHDVVVDSRLPYVSDGEGLHAFTDPIDGERYLGGYLGLDVTQRLFACFDQLDLKAPVTLAVEVGAADWTVLSNGRPEAVEGGLVRFATTPPIPVDLVVVCAGPWHSVTWEHRGVPMGWHARRSQRDDLERDAAELRRTTQACFDHYVEVFDEPFPFDSYDQVFVPELNWGAMETPGCVTFRDELLPRGRVTHDERRLRAMVIAHEMSHMWFGDLVSPVWWEDAWLNESFADYMGFEVAETAVGYVGARVAFEASYKPVGYLADRRRSTHPVAPHAQDVPDVGTGTTIFDAISYNKGNAVIRQLVAYLGKPDFLAGVNAHLTRHRFANATLADLIGALDAVSPHDVHGWAEVWLRTSGHDTIRVGRDGDVPVLIRDGIRPHRFTVTAYDDALAEVGSAIIDLHAEPRRLPQWAGRVVVPNAQGETFARVILDEHSWAAVSTRFNAIADPVTRAVLWATAFDNLPSRDLLQLLARALPREPVPALAEAAVGWVLREVVPKRLTPDEVALALGQLAAACAAGLGAGPDDELAIALTRGLAHSTVDVDLLHRWLALDRTDAGLSLDPALRWLVLHRLAELGAIGDAEIEAERRRDSTAAGDLGAFTARAAIPSVAAKERAWAAMTQDPDVSNRTFRALAVGFWSAERPALLAPWVGAYVVEAPRLARRGSAFAAAVGHCFPSMPLDGDQLGLVRDALDADLPTVLRRGWQDALDDRDPARLTSGGG